MVGTVTFIEVVVTFVGVTLILPNFTDVVPLRSSWITALLTTVMVRTSPLAPEVALNDSEVQVLANACPVPDVQAPCAFSPTVRRVTDYRRTFIS